jgi:hypothetical protein
MPTAILELLVIGAKIFSDERKHYFEEKAKAQLKKILEVEDSEFYKKDMEAKGQAERQIILDTEELRKQFILESSK